MEWVIDTCTCILYVYICVYLLNIYLIMTYYLMSISDLQNSIAKCKNKTKTKQTGKTPEQTFLKRRLTITNRYMKKILNVTSHHRYASQDHNVYNLRTIGMTHQKIKGKKYQQGHGEKGTCLYCWGDVNWCSFYGSQYGGL